MGFFDRFRRPKSAPPLASPLATVPVPSSPAPFAAAPQGRLPGFAVIDVETTGLSANDHRVLELAIVRTYPRHPGGRRG